MGRRVQRSKGSVWVKYVYDGQDVVRDINSDSSTTEYLNGLGIDDKIRQTSSSGTVYFTQDHLGSTRALTDTSGNVVESINYDSFGNGSSSLTRYGYTGREWDADSNLYYYRARWYDAQSGRFISEDPIGLMGGINLYAYVVNNPVNYTDPSGLRHIIGDDNVPPLPPSLGGRTECFEWLPDWMGYNSCTENGIWWSDFWKAYHEIKLQRAIERGDWIRLPGGGAMPLPMMGCGMTIVPGFSGAARTWRTVIEESTAALKADKLTGSAREGYSSIIDMLAQGRAGRNQHSLTGKLKGKSAVDLPGTGKGRGAGRVIYSETPSQVTIFDILDYHK